MRRTRLGKKKAERQVKDLYKKEGQMEERTGTKRDQPRTYQETVGGLPPLLGGIRRGGAEARLGREKNTSGE